MAAVAEGAINGEFAWLHSEDFHDLPEHNRPMCAGGRLSTGDHLRDVAGITLRRVLFILFRKMPRIPSSVSLPARGFFRSHVARSIIIEELYGQNDMKSLL